MTKKINAGSSQTRMTNLLNNNVANNGHHSQEEYCAERVDSFYRDRTIAFSSLAIDLSFDELGFWIERLICLIGQVQNGAPTLQLVAPMVYN